MSKSNPRSQQTSDQTEQPHAQEQQTAENTGRDASGRFTAGNAGGPGNPFARRVAQLRSILLETVTDGEMRLVAGELVLKAKFGDLAAIKLLFQYVLGKPAATVDPDALDVEEIELFRRAPLQGSIPEIAGSRLPADVAVDLLRILLPALGQAKAEMLRDALHHPERYEEKPDPLYDFEEDDFEDEEIAEDELQAVGVGVEEAAETSRAAPSTNGERCGNGRPRATRPSTNGRTSQAKPQAGPQENGDNHRRSSGRPGSDRRPPRGT